MITNIIKYGDPLLKEPSEQVTEELENLEEIIAKLKYNLYFFNGLGLSAIQIGYKSQIFVMAGKEVKVLINTQIIEESEEKIKDNEGCLSFPYIFIPKLRPKWVKAVFLNEKMEKNEEVFTDLEARIVIHEYEHGLGKLFLEDVSQTYKEIVNQKIKKLKSRGVWELDKKVLALIQKETGSVK